MERLGTETAFSVLAKAKALEAGGREIIHLEIGEPDFGTPDHVVEAGCRALRDGHTHYTPTAGIPELREAIAEDVALSRGIEVRPEQVVVTPGGKPIMFFAILALVDEGDEVLLPSPAFPIYESMVNFVGGKPVYVPLRQENGFRFDPEEFEANLSERTRLVILNSPANPTGGVLTADDMATLAGILREHPGVYVLSDEIYSRLLYTGEFRQHRRARGSRPRPAHRHTRRLLEDLRDDGLAPRLRRHAPRPRRAGRQTAGQLQLLHQRGHPTRRARCLERSPGRRRGDAGRVPRAERPDRRRPQPASRRRMHHAARRFLRVPAHHELRAIPPTSLQTCSSTKPA